MQLLKFISMRYCRLGRLEQPVSQPFASPVAYLCLSLVLSGTACNKTHSTQFLYLLCIIKSADIPHFCQYSSQNVLTNTVNLKKVFCIWYFHAFLV